MFETFRHIRGQLLLMAIGYIVLGVLMLAQPGLFLKMICYIAGGLLIAYGVIGILGCVRQHTIRMFTMAYSVLLAAVGIFVITQPHAVVSILPVVFGVILLLDGIFNVWHGIGLYRFRDSGYVMVLILGVITVVLGAVILLNPYSTAQMTFRIVGAALAYNGVSDLLVLYRMNHAAKTYGTQAGSHSNQVIDVEARPVDDEEE